ncbi:LPD25 domain-containing protein [Vibrio rumoiensis]|uniref:LPD25 domain-containing protein n=1 Tax=Vibrio rumoiensis TaxID=76258 RepID=UPI003AA95177
MKLNETTDDSTPNKLIPKSVFVHGSESRQFQTNDIWDFDDFEKKALEVALDNPKGGYDKTFITVTFHDSSEHQCRLDLGCNVNDLGFSDHCLSVYDYHQQNHDKPEMAWMREDHQLELIGLIEHYQLDRVQVQQARAKAGEVIKEVKRKQEKEQRQKIKEREESIRAHQQKEQAFQESLNVPEWAQAVIIATKTEYDSENSCPHTDIYESKTIKTIILAWSKHTQQRFPEMRKACLNHPDTAFLHDKTQSKEQRDNYSMGAGNYLTENNYLYHGWKVRKQRFWDENNKARSVPLGELVEGVNEI